MSNQETEREGSSPAAADGPSRAERQPCEAESASQGVSRRGFLQALGLGAAATLPQDGLVGRVTPPLEEESSSGPDAVAVRLRVNGETIATKVEPRVTLLDAIRNHLKLDTDEHVDLTGSKRVCDRGSCGACTVILDGKTVYACTVLAIEAQGRDIRTVEGLATDGKLHPVQEEFIHKDGLMCGFCTPGFVVAAAALLDKNPSPSRDEIRRALDGNICRCGTQNRALEAVEEAAKKGGR